MKRIRLTFEGLRIALRSLRQNPLRTGLTMLGVGVGIFAITIIFTLVDSLNHNINKNLASLGNSVLYVHRVPWTSEALEKRKFLSWPSVSYDDYRYLDRNLKGAESISFEARFPGQFIKRKGLSVENVFLLGVTPGYFEINDYEFAMGRPFTELENNGGRPVCVIGSEVSNALFGETDPALKEIRVKGRPVTVVGVLEKRGADIMGMTPDDRVFVPFLYSARVFDTESQFADRMITMRIADPKRSGEVENEVIGMMRAARGLRPASENNFAVNKPEMIMTFTGDITDVLRIVGIFISIFSIIVGGFGIGNIMFSTVKERTFEIGLQKSLGATPGFILFQFLAEAVMLCLAGGVAGMGLQALVLYVGQGALEAMEYNFELIVSWSSLFIGTLLSVLIGLVSGIIPSLIAARLDPIESMRR